MTDTILLVNGLTPLQTWGLVALVCFALAGVWSLLSLCLDWLNDWLNERAYDAQYRANEERQSKAWTAAADDVTKQLKKAWTASERESVGCFKVDDAFDDQWSTDMVSEERQREAWTRAQEKFKAGRRVQ